MSSSWILGSVGEGCYTCSFTPAFPVLIVPALQVETLGFKGLCSSTDGVGWLGVCLQGWTPSPHQGSRHTSWAVLVHTEHSRKKSRQCEFCNIERVQFNDCPSSKDYVLPTSFSLKCLFLNDVYDKLTVIHGRGLLRCYILSALVQTSSGAALGVGGLCSASLIQTPRFFCVLCFFFYLLTPKHKLSNLYLLHKLVGCFFLSTMRQKSSVRLQLLRLTLSI